MIYKELLEIKKTNLNVKKKSTLPSAKEEMTEIKSQAVDVIADNTKSDDEKLSALEQLAGKFANLSTKIGSADLNELLQITKTNILSKKFELHELNCIFQYYRGLETEFMVKENDEIKNNPSKCIGNVIIPFSRFQNRCSLSA